MTLEWRDEDGQPRGDRYHQRSLCGQYAVAYVVTGLTAWYEAYRWPGTLLGATRLPITASREEKRQAAAAMRELCEAEAGVQSPPTEVPS